MYQALPPSGRTGTKKFADTSSARLPRQSPDGSQSFRKSDSFCIEALRELGRGVFKLQESSLLCGTAARREDLGETARGGTSRTFTRPSVRSRARRGDPLPLRILSVCCHGNLKVSLIVESRGRRQTRSTELSRPLARAALVIQWRIDIVRPFWPSGSLGLWRLDGTARSRDSS